MLELSTVQQVVVWILPVLFAITMHEAAHAWAASLLGDTTPRQEGRLSFNPLHHIDLIGTILVPAVLILSHSPFLFGWAKPVNINASRFKNYRKGIFLSTAAGPAANLLMAIIWAFLCKVALMMNPQTSDTALFLALSANAGIFVNLLLAFFNLIPIPPLDGSKILSSLLPVRQAMAYDKLAPWGFFILLALMFSGVLNWLIVPVLHWSVNLLSVLFKL